MNKLASQYGKALFEAARADNSEKELKNELDKLNNASYAESSGDALLELVNANLLGSFEDVYRAFAEKYNEYHGTIDVEVVSAFPLAEKERKLLFSKLQALTGKKVNLAEQVDNSLIGGIILKFDGNEIDGSFKAKLQNIRRNII